MTDTISADYSLRPDELASTLALLVEARQPVVVWGGPGCAKSQIAQQVAAQAGREYVDGCCQLNEGRSQFERLN